MVAQLQDPWGHCTEVTCSLIYLTYIPHLYYKEISKFPRNSKEFQNENRTVYTDTPKINYVNLNLTKFAQDLYEQNDKTLVDKTRELNTLRDSPCSWIIRLTIVQISVVPQLIHRFSAIAIWIPASYFVDVDEEIPSCVWGEKGSE